MTITPEKKRSVLTTKLNDKIMSTGEIEQKVSSVVALIGEKADDRAKKRFAVSDEIVPEFQGAYTGGGVTVIGMENAGEKASLAYSDDNFATVKKTELDKIPGKNFKSIVYAPEKKVFVATTNTEDGNFNVFIYASTTGKAWTRVCTHAATSSLKVAYDRELGIFIAGGWLHQQTGENIFVYSEDGYNWEEVKRPVGFLDNRTAMFSSVERLSHANGVSKYALIDFECEAGRKSYVSLEVKRVEGDLVFDLEDGSAAETGVNYSTPFATFALGGTAYACSGGGGYGVFIIAKLGADATTKAADLPDGSFARCAVVVNDVAYIGLRNGKIAKATVSGGALSVEEWVTIGGPVEAILPQADGSMYAIGRQNDSGKIWKIGADKTVTEVSFQFMVETAGGTVPAALTTMMTKYSEMEDVETIVTSGENTDDILALATKLNTLIGDFNEIKNVFVPSV